MTDSYRRADPVIRCDRGHVYAEFFSCSALGYLGLVEECPRCGADIALYPGTVKSGISNDQEARE